MLHRSIIRLRCSEIALCLVTDRTVFARAEMAGPLINYVLFRFDTILSLVFSSKGGALSYVSMRATYMGWPIPATSNLYLLGEPCI